MTQNESNPNKEFIENIIKLFSLIDEKTETFRVNNYLIESKPNDEFRILEYLAGKTYIITTRKNMLAIMKVDGKWKNKDKNTFCPLDNTPKFIEIDYYTLRSIKNQINWKYINTIVGNKSNGLKRIRKKEDIEFDNIKLLSNYFTTRITPLF